MPTHDIDLIIIGLNEAQILPDTFAAAQSAAETALSERNLRTRILFINDYFTTDHSAQIAESYGIEHFRGNPDYTRPGNNRMSGLVLSDSTMVMLLDGDCILNAGWLSAAAGYLNENKRVGALVGIVDLRRMVGPSEILLPNVGKITRPGPLDSTHTGSGSLFVRRQALEDCGGIEPDLDPMQDVELICAIKSSGWEVHRIPEKMETHAQTHLSGSTSALRKLKVLLPNTLRMGVHLRNSISKGFWRCLLPYFKYEALHLAWLVSIGLLTYLATESPALENKLLASVGLLSLAYLLQEMRRKGSPLLALVSLAVLTLRVLGITLGLLTNFPHIEWGAQNQPEFKQGLLQANLGATES